MQCLVAAILVDVDSLYAMQSFNLDEVGCFQTFIALFPC
jgi:hypothetical protein